MTQARFDMLTHAVTDTWERTGRFIQTSRGGEGEAGRAGGVTVGNRLGFAHRRVVGAEGCMEGSALAPSVRDALRGLFGDKLVLETHCDEVVAEGAAMHAQMRYDHKREDEERVRRSAQDASGDPDDDDGSHVRRRRTEDTASV